MDLFKNGPYSTLKTALILKLLDAKNKNNIDTFKKQLNKCSIKMPLHSFTDHSCCITTVIVLM